MFTFFKNFTFFTFTLAAALSWLLPTAQAQQPSTQATSEAQWLAPSATLMDFEVRGTVGVLPYSTTGQLSWLPAPAIAPTSYEARLHIQLPLLGARTQTSTGTIGVEGLSPHVFIDRSRKEHITTLDAARGQVHFSRGDAPQPWQPRIQDRVSVFFQLAGMLAAAPTHYRAGTTITLPVASRSSITQWSFRIDQAETLQLPAGRVQALRLHHLRAHTSADPTDQRLQSALWLAPELGYLPVRIRLSEDDGDFVELRLRSSRAATP